MLRKLISLCMIVRDEETALPRCLESVRGVVDEMIVVDTGSVDRTREIAARYGARVLREPWRRDFAAARNVGLKRARGEWILFLDADEAIDMQDRAKLRAWVERQGEACEGLFLRIRNEWGEGDRGATINPVLRLFRNRPEHRFEGRIHEQIAAPICRRNPQAAFVLTDITIHHYGYRPEIVAAKGKIARNLELLREIVREHPEDPFHWFNLGVERMRGGDHPGGLIALREAKRRIDPAACNYAHLLDKYEAKCLAAMGRPDEAALAYAEARRQHPDYPDLPHGEAVVWIALGRTDRAEAALRAAVMIGEAPPGYHTEEGIGTYQTLYLLGQLREAAGRVEEAIGCYLDALRCKSDLNPPLQRIYHLLRLAGREWEIPQFVAERLELRTKEAAAKAALLARRCRCYEAARELEQAYGLKRQAGGEAAAELWQERLERAGRANDHAAAGRLLAERAGSGPGGSGKEALLLGRGLAALADIHLERREGRVAARAETEAAGTAGTGAAAAGTAGVGAEAGAGVAAAGTARVGAEAGGEPGAEARVTGAGAGASLNWRVRRLLPCDNGFG